MWLVSQASLGPGDRAKLLIIFKRTLISPRTDSPLARPVPQRQLLELFCFPLKEKCTNGQQQFFFFLIYLLFIYGCVGSSFLCEGFL